MMGSYDFRLVEEFARAGRSTSVDDTQIFWTERGSERQPALVFLHGIPTWSYLWRDVIEETGSAYRSIALDLPGFGLSDKSSGHPFRVQALATTVNRLLDDIVGPDRQVSLVVHDFGALVGAEMLKSRPERIDRLIITNTSLRSVAWLGGLSPLSILGVPYLGNLSMWLARPWMLRMAMRPFVADPDALAPELVAGYWYPFEQGFGSSLARLYRERAFAPGDFDPWREALANFSGKSLIAWGERDPAFTLDDVDDLTSLLSNAETVIFENASHFLPEERPRALGRLIRAFLEDRIS
jgi:pimeloyl-ACP methyl ester carboxylesterase